MDEHALSDGGPGDVAVGTALLMADLEAAIASAGAEIAVFRSVADAMPRVRPALSAIAEPQPAVGDPDRAVVAPDREPVVPSGLPDLLAAVPVAAPALAVETARAAAVALPDRGDAAGGGSDVLPAYVAAPRSSPTMRPVTEADEILPRADVRASVSKFETVVGAVAPRPDRLSGTAARANAPEIAPTHDVAASDWAWPLPVAAAPPSMANVGLQEAAAPMAGFEPTVGRAAAPVGTSLVEPPASGSSDAGPNRASTAADQGRGASAEAAHSGPTEGDVFLDGERVGRWMARHLARELGGPAASGTAFDPRTGPAWPGTLHGN